MTPQIQKPAPDFKGTAVVSGKFREIKLSDYKGKYLVIFFYPNDFASLSPSEITDFSNEILKFCSLNCELIGVSHFTHKAWINTPRNHGGLEGINFPLLAIARAYGVLQEESGISFRGLFIIDEKQNLRQITVNDFRVGRFVDETLRLVQALQVTDANYVPLD